MTLQMLLSALHRGGKTHLLARLLQALFREICDSVQQNFRDCGEAYFHPRPAILKKTKGRSGFVRAPSRKAALEPTFAEESHCTATPPSTPPSRRWDGHQLPARCPKASLLPNHSVELRLTQAAGAQPLGCHQHPKGSESRQSNQDSPRSTQHFVLYFPLACSAVRQDTC